MKTLMQCGHTAQAIDSEGRPVCVICVGLHPGADKPVENPPDLTGRYALCCYCNRKVESNFSLPFFEYRPGSTIDGYYDGCKGFD